jgi:hypothetical protein
MTNDVDVGAVGVAVVLAAAAGRRARHACVYIVVAQIESNKIVLSKYAQHNGVHTSFTRRVHICCTCTRAERFAVHAFCESKHQYS